MPIWGTWYHITRARNNKLLQSTRVCWVPVVYWYIFIWRVHVTHQHTHVLYLGIDSAVFYWSAWTFTTAVCLYHPFFVLPLPCSSRQSTCEPNKPHIRTTYPLCNGHVIVFNTHCSVRRRNPCNRVVFFHPTAVNRSSCPSKPSVPTACYSTPSDRADYRCV